MTGSHDKNDDSFSHATSRDYGIAFGLTILAGFATLIGGGLVLWLLDCNQGNNKDERSSTLQQDSHAALLLKRQQLWLGGGLAVAAGSIVYVAFADLLPEGMEFFAADAETEHAQELSTFWTTLCFFAGGLFMALWTFAVHNLYGKRDGGANDDDEEEEEEGYQKKQLGNDEEIGSNSSDNGTEESPSLGIIENQEKTTLCHSGMSVTLALILHSLPEGFVTFIATAQDPTIGVALAIGIGIHNLAEGMSIALPIYFATAQYTKALGATAVAGLAPILGGAIGYVILQTNDREWSNTAFGVMFGWAAGMLIYVAVKELLRTAYKYDKDDRVTTFGFFVGMAVIALALVILESTGNHNHALMDGDDDGHHGNVWDMNSMKEESAERDGHVHGDDTHPGDTHH